MGAATWYLPIRLDAESYRRLTEAAQAEDRDPLQQARHLLRRALAGGERPTTSAPERGDVGE
jgi:hypothetical protein